MRRLTLRSQVAIASALAILLAVALLGIALHLLLSRELHRQLDSDLRRRAADVATLSVSAPALLTSPGALDSSSNGVGLDVQVVDRSGAILSRSLALGARSLPTDALSADVIRSGRAGYRNGTLDGQPIRIDTAPLPKIGGGRAAGGAVIVASPTDQIDHTLHRLRLLTLLAALGAAALAAPASLLMTRRVLRPLSQLSTDAALIGETADPSRRVATSASDDEVATLADALNAMLAALERARDGERRFLADASHELRNPLTALRGNAAYLARQAPDQPAFADLEADIARLGRLVDLLLAVAREDAADPPTTRVPVRELLTEAVASENGVAVSVEGDPVVRGDADAIRRAVRNLVENATRYGEPPISVTAGQAHGWVVITVTDTGSGIAPELVKDAGRRFWRGPNGAGTEGSGLGLALVRATAERHGGELTIDGARFTITLPAPDDGH
jgi:two-component system, OmpR family, sensor kinase